jgi:DNA repair protein RadC
VKIRSAKDVVPLVSHLANRQQEHFLTVSLNGAHEVIASRVVTVGLANSTQIHPREVFAEAISDRACAIIAAHNHPSGDLSPSTEDLAVTERLTQAGGILGIRLLDHIIFSANGFFSFAEAGMMGDR